MFDAKSLLEALVKGAAPAPAEGQPAQQTGLGGLGDLLGQVLGGGGQAGHGQGTRGQGGDLGGLGDLLGKLGQAAPGAAPAQQAPASGGIDDLLRRIGGAAQSGAQPGGQSAPQAGGGGLMDILGQVLGQATSGAKEGAGRLDQATGASDRAREALGQATGQNPDEVLAQIKKWVGDNQLAAGAAAGGLGGLVLGTRTGRSAAASAAKLGALVMIGGLAYKAYQNYSQGKPVLDAGQAGQAMGLTAAPAGSGFEPDAITNDDALLYIRAMIGAAAADGRIDQAEQQRILGGLRQAGLADAAVAFLESEIQNPASPTDLISQISSEGQAVQVFTAARLAVEVDTQQEHDYLMALAQGLGMDGSLVAHIDAEATALAA